MNRDNYMQKSSVIVEEGDTEVMVTLKRLRGYANLSQEEFAKKYGIPPATYRKWENGYRVPPEYVISMLERIVWYEKQLGERMS